MILCPACGKENDDRAVECRRCRAPFQESAGEEAGSEQLGEVCRRCDSYNDPGATRCSSCGYLLGGTASPSPSASAAPSDDLAAVPDELSTLVLAAVESSEPAEALAGATVGGAALARRIAEPRPAPALPVASEKPCLSCHALNPPAAKFCCDCGTAFAKMVPPPAQPRIAPAPLTGPEPEPTVQVDDAFVLETADLVAEEPEGQAEAPAPEPGSEPLDASAVAGPVTAAIEEAAPPYPASLIVEKGVAPGTTYAIEHMENLLGAQGAHIELVGDPYVAPRAATLLFVEDRLLIRDEGSVNGVFVRLRQPVPLEPGDAFIAGERLLRYEGSAGLPIPSDDPPCLGSPRPAGPAVRITEVLAGGKTGRVCVRAGTIAVGRSGCDLSFPGDSLLAPRHAEVRLADDGAATLVDAVQAPAGVWLRLRSQSAADLTAGDELRIGDQQLRIELS